jgi:DNA repair protein SbcC/Rad50
MLAVYNEKIMIPVRLELKNFLPYISPDPIYFEGIHLACLTGDNGAGKSSLLDAITWALWGKARARRDDDLVHQGREEMHVQLDFEQEGVIYRVFRQRKGGRRGQGLLNLFVLQTDGKPHLINEPSMRQTQQKIDEMLRLDYDTFVNSAFLQQGKADVFTTKTPAERKKILSDILGLEQWSHYEERSKEKLKALEKQLASIDGVLNAIEEELAKEGLYRRDKETAERAYSIAQQALVDAEKLLAEVADAPADLRNATDQQASIERRIKSYENDLVSVGNDIRKREAAIARYEETINLADNIETGYQNLQNAREADSTLGAKLRVMSDLDKRYSDLQTQLASARSELEAERSGYEASMRETERLLVEDGGEALAEIHVEITSLERLEDEREILQEGLAQMREERSGLEAQFDTLAAEGKKLNERINTLEKTDGALCPLCGQPLDAEHLEKILAEITEERDSKRAAWAQSRDRVQEIKSTEQEQKRHIESIGRQLSELPQLRSQAGALQKQVDDSVAAQSRLNESQAVLLAVEQILENDDYAHELRQQITDVQTEREALGYDREAHESIQSRLSEYREYEKQHTQLQIARETLPREIESLESALERKERLETAMEEEAAAQAQWNTKIAALQERVNEYHRRTQEVAMQRTTATQAYGRVVEADQQLSALDSQRKRKADLQTRREGVEGQQHIYEELKMAFGKNGVPAMIIETAIPELEVAANELLARMTDGRMNLRFSTQREKVSGGTMETLDIDIADELGTRAYEMYSGGEAFRINFAIRVALSRMLARRAGAHLRTLFIDEGFGTQDDDGRNKLVEAITAIQSDFDLILVITHMADLQDAFPVHIVVEKTANGSMVAVR